MKVVYIKETEEICDFIKRIIIKIKYVFNVIDRKIVNDKTIFYLPIFKNNKLSKRKIKKLSDKIDKLLDEEESNIVALSKNLSLNKILKNNLYCKNIHILDGRFLFKCMSYKMIEYIFKIKEIESKFGEVTFLINDFNEINKEIIIYIAKKIKRLNIVTNNIDKCKKIEEYLYDEFGIIINISNNKRRSLLKAELIINIDFPEELVNKYRINNEAIIINTNDKINIHSKRFYGININSYRIKMNPRFKIPSFSNKISYESLIYKLANFESINTLIAKDGIEIDKFIGNNGIIEENNFKKRMKSIDKSSIKE